MKQITSEQFDRYLMKILDNMTASQIIDIGGVYEILAEYFNNDVIDAIECDAEDNDE